MQSHWDKRDRQVAGKVESFLNYGEYVQGALILKRGFVFSDISIPKFLVLIASAAISLLSLPFGSSLLSFGLRGANEARPGSQLPVIVATNQRIFITWDTHEISRSIAITDVAPRGTYMTLNPNVPIRLGLSKYYLKRGQKRKIEFLNSLAPRQQPNYINISN